MKTIICISVMVLSGLVLVGTPATGFDLPGKLTNPGDKLGIPDPIVDRVGSLMYTIKLKVCKLCTSSQELSLVKGVWTQLITASPQCEPYKNAKVKKWQWQMSLVDDVTTFDAEAFPGGKVLVYKGVCAMSRGDRAQMAFVLSHEMAHALARHAKARFDKKTKQALLSAATDGTLNAADLPPEVTLGAMTAMGVAYENAQVVPFSKAQELEADRNALLIMAQAGYDPEASLKYLKNCSEFLNKNGSKATRSALDDHPPIQEREANLREYMPEALDIYQNSRKG